MSEHDVSRMTRAELNDYAGGLGIADAAEMANKDEVMAAIDAALAEQDDLSAHNADAEYRADTTDVADDNDDAEPEQSGKRYEVLKAVTDEDGRTYMPGEEFTPGSGFPSRRPKQLVEQKFLRPLD